MVFQKRLNDRDKEQIKYRYIYKNIERPVTNLFKYNTAACHTRSTLIQEHGHNTLDKMSSNKVKKIHNHRKHKIKHSEMMRSD